MFQRFKKYVEIVRIYPRHNKKLIEETSVERTTRRSVSRDPSILLLGFVDLFVESAGTVELDYTSLTFDQIGPGPNKSSIASAKDHHKPFSASTRSCPGFRCTQHILARITKAIRFSLSLIIVGNLNAPHSPHSLIATAHFLVSFGDLNLLADPHC